MTDSPVTDAARMARPTPMPDPTPAPTAGSLADRARRLAAAFDARAGEHDDHDRFVADNYAVLKAEGLVAAGVPAALGGAGAEVRDLAAMLRTLAHGCASTALALSMHTHQVAIPAWRWRNQPAAKAAVEPVLKRVAASNAILLTSGGSDWVGGSGRAERVPGGYRIHARKVFASGAPAGALLVTGAICEDEVIHFAVPLDAPEVTLLDTWHTLGMRGTGSQDIVIDGFFVPDDKVALKRRAGEWHPLFQIITTIAFPLIFSVYLGVAESAADIALAVARGRAGASRNPATAGEMMTRLRAAQMAHGAMVDAAERMAPSADSVNEVQIGRRLVEENAIRTVELAMELAGGAGFYRAAGLERRFRDVQGARYHPMKRENQFRYAGSMALGDPVAAIF
jgi:alkylation response protein AidB-like acyl-CoA dehydrogenase